MKEKIKNFLLKIKNLFKQKHTFTFIELIVIAILINFITMFLSFVEINALDLCFNETHTEQIEETPQTEFNRIDRGIKGASNIYDSFDSLIGIRWYLKPINEIDINTTFNESPTITTTDSNIVVGTLYLSDNSSFDIKKFNSSNYVIVISQYDVKLTMYSFINSYVIANQTTNTSNSYIVRRFIGASFVFNDVDVVVSSSFVDGWLKYFTDVNPNPTLVNAPSSLVNTIPSNAVTTLPNDLGTKVYDSGSGVTITESGSEYNTFGFQVYYESNISYSETELYRFTIDGITYDVEPNVYRYYLNDVNVVIYTLWNNTPIYYVFENLLMGGDWPFTLDYETRFNFTDLTNMFASSVYIVDTYSDYIHINIEFAYLMTLDYDGDTQYLIDTDEAGLNALIYSTTHQGNYGDKGFDLDIIPQLDKNYSKMGVSQTNNMYSTIVHGGTINQVWSNAYHKGIGVGETNGYTNGYNDGIETGKTLQNPLNPIMDFISDGALVISNVFSFEILPNISLGTMLLFPLAIALIWFVIKLFMGG